VIETTAQSWFAIGASFPPFDGGRAGAESSMSKPSDTMVLSPASHTHHARSAGASRAARDARRTLASAPARQDGALFAGRARSDDDEC